MKYFLSLLGMLSISLLPVPGSPGESSPASRIRAAYRNYYQGLLHYSEGHFGRAESHLQRAHQIAPENFNFSLALALCLSRVEQGGEGLSLLGRTALPATDPYYEHKRAIRLFVKGMVLYYTGRSTDAIRELERSIEAARLLHMPDVEATFENALGFVILHHQGSGSNHSDELPLHYHVHRRDMMKALQHFERALAVHPQHVSARKNARMLWDTLQLAPPAAIRRSDTAGRRGVSSLVTGLPQDVERVRELAGYDEVLLLVDISGSMTQEQVLCMGLSRFEVMRNLGLYLVRELPDTAGLALGTVGGDCGDAPKQWIATDSMGRRDLTYVIRFLTAHGTTPLLERVEQSVALFSDRPGKSRAIFLISDGANVCRSGGEDICGWASRIRRAGITINVLTFLDASFNNVEAFSDYGCLADHTGGRIFYLDNVRCAFTDLSFKLLDNLQLRLPPLQKVYCWGPQIESLWAIFPEEK